MFSINHTFRSAMLVLAAAAIAPAATIVTYTTPVNANVGTDRPVNAEAVFTLGTGTISLTLTNLQSNPRDVTQLISDIFFSVSNGATALTAGTVTGSGTEITVNSNGTYTLGSTVNAGWVLTNSSGLYHLDVLAGPGHAGPEHLIIGGPNGSNKYSNANGSLKNGAHNPFLNGSATFTLTIPGVNEHSTISNVAFSFGTTPGLNVTGITTTSTIPQTATPEPGTVALVGSALVFVGWLGKRRRS